MQIVLVLVIILILMYYVYKKIKSKYDAFSIEQNATVKSDIDGRTYYVHTKHENLNIAADMFAEVNHTVTEIINYIYTKYKFSDNSRKREIAKNLLMRYDVNNLRENSPLNSERDTSYTINKGDIIAICIRSREGANQIHDYGTILFVVLHEITHISISSYDHPEEFWETFKFILMEAEESGLYTSPEFMVYPKEYCGIKINYNPRFDRTIKLI